MPNVELPAEAGEKTVAFAGRHRQSGFTAIENELLFDATLSIQARMLYVLLSSYAWKSDSCWPGQQGLATAMGVTDKTLRNYIAELTTGGLLEVRRRGQMLTNVYVLHSPDSRTVISTDHDGSSTSDHDRDPTTDEEDEGQQEGVEGKSSSSSLTLSPARSAALASAGAREAPRLCNELADSIQRNSLRGRRPVITQAWLDTIRRLVDRDGATPEAVSNAIRWAESHDFWSTVILSPQNLRKHFERMNSQAHRGQTPSKTFSERRYDEAQDSLRSAMDRVQAGGVL